MYLISSWVECFYTNVPIDFSRTIYLNNIYHYIITKIHLEYFYLLQRQLFEGVFDYLDLDLDCNVGRIIMQLDCRKTRSGGHFFLAFLLLSSKFILQHNWKPQGFQTVNFSRSVLDARLIFLVFISSLLYTPNGFSLINHSLWYH